MQDEESSPEPAVEEDGAAAGGEESAGRGDDGLAGAAVRSAAWSALEKWGAKAVSTLVLILLARRLDPADFGIVALAMVFVTFVEVAMVQGFGSALVQRRDLEKGHLDTVFWAGLVIGALLVGLTQVLAEPVAALLDEPDLAGVLRWLSVTFLMVGIGSAPQALLERELQFQALAARRVIAVVVSGTTAVVMALNGFGVMALVAQVVLLYTVMTIVMWATIDYRPGFDLSVRHARDVLGFSASTTGMRLLFVAMRKVDDLLIGVVLGPVALGYYDIAYRLLLVLTALFTGTMTSVGLPVFSRLQNDLPRLRRAFMSAVRMTAAVTFPAFIGVAVLAGDIIPTVFGDQWGQSVPVMRILAIGGAMHALSYYNPAMLTAVGRPALGLLLAAVSAAVSIAGFAIAVNFGLVAVAIAYSLREYVVLPLPLLQLRSLIGLDIGAYLRQLIVPTVCTVVMALAVLGISVVVEPLASIPRLLIAVPVGVLVYGGAMALLGRPLFTEMLRYGRKALPGGAADPQTAR